MFNAFLVILKPTLSKNGHKKIKIYVFVILFLFTRFTVFAQTGLNMNPKPYKTDFVKKGANPLMQYQTLEINPINLFVQDKPWSDRSVRIQLELKVTEKDKKFSTFLWYYSEVNNPPQNYPQAFGKYTYGLEISKQQDEQLVVDELKLKNSFFINLGHDAVIGDLRINFKESMDVMGASIDGNPSKYDSYADYQLILMENGQQETLSFSSIDFNEGKLSLKWKDYEIKVLYNEVKVLQLVVFKKSVKK